MSVALAVACGVGAAVAYGAATAAQHASAYRGEADARGLMLLLKDPRWLAATAGDGVGVLLQVIALYSGPVVLVQPLLVLALPIAVILRSLFGAPRPRRSDLINCAVVVLALSGFFAVLGSPARGRIIATQPAMATVSIAALGGVLALVAARNLSPARRAVVFGAVAGVWFGVVSVLIEAVSDVWQREGLEGFGDARGAIALVGVLVLAIGGYLLVQIGFQLGPLAASFPANLVLDPIVAVLLGAALLSERVPHGPLALVGYAVCLGAITWAAIRLAEPPHRSEPASATMRA